MDWKTKVAFGLLALVVIGLYFRAFDSTIASLKEWYTANSNTLFFLLLAAILIYFIFQKHFFKDPKGIHITTTEAIDSFWTHGGSDERWWYSVLRQFYEFDPFAGGTQKVGALEDNSVDFVWYRRAVAGVGQLPAQILLGVDCRLAPVPVGTRMRVIGDPLKIFANSRQVDLGGLAYRIYGSAKKDIVDISKRLQYEGYDAEEQALLLQGQTLMEKNSDTQTQKR